MAVVPVQDTNANRAARWAAPKLVRSERGYLLLVVVVGLLAAWRLGGPGLIANYDSELHLYRVFVLDRALWQGLLFPRVLPDLMFGYGYPLFNFYPPASTYFVELLHLLGFGFLTAVSVAYGTSFVLGGITMYAFARSAFDRPGGAGLTKGWAAGDTILLRGAALVAASAYVLAPYYLINVYMRGAVAEALAMAILPALLLAIQRVIVGAGKVALVALALLTALLVLTHSGLALISLPVAAGYGLVVAWRLARANRRQALAWLLGGLLLGLALSAFFWLPAALERSYVSIQSIETSTYDVHGNFQEWSTLVSRDLFYPPTDPIPNPPRLGMLQALLGLVALPLIFRRSGWSRATTIFWAAVAVGALFLMTPGSALIWDTLPLLRSLSFAWRMLSIVALALALLAGSLVLAFRPRLAFAAALAIVLTSMVVTLPRLAPTKLGTTERDLSIGRYWRFEFETTMVGTTSANEYVPLALQAGTYALPRAPEQPHDARAAQAGLTASVRLLEAGAQQIHLRVAGDETTRIVGHAVYFPGWRARIDGAYASPYASTPLGLVTVDVPAGEHDLLLFYDQSDVARTAGIASLMAALAIPALLFTVGRRETGRVGLRFVVAWSSAVLWLAAIALAVWQPLPQVTAVLTPQSTDAAISLATSDLELLGWRPPTERAGSVRFDLYWLARHTPARDEVVAVSLVDSQGAVRAQWEQQPQFGYSPTRRWVSGEVVPDEYDLALPLDLPAGDYSVSVALRGIQGGAGIGSVHVSVGTLALTSPKAPPR